MNPAEEPRDKLAVKVSDAERDIAVERLKDHYVAGRLSLSELEDRATVAYQAATVAQLGAITADLPAQGKTSERTSTEMNPQVLILLLCFCPPRRPSSTGSSPVVRPAGTTRIHSNGLLVCSSSGNGRRRSQA
ncbi:DUF1707 domain-containing protein [Streptomyces sp. NPDC059717]|uniref:DUF1707 SHOCT-like domain-containing protein n=1 Tax=Streptomyces sp. NPDC059717 TaxID=3346922 RepID=UPI0036C725F7